MRKNRDLAIDVVDQWWQKIL